MSNQTAEPGFFVIDGRASFAPDGNVFHGEVFLPTKKGGGTATINVGTVCRTVRHQLGSCVIRGPKPGVVARMPINGNPKVSKLADYFDKKPVTCPSAIASLIKKQNHGEEGVLRTDGKPNLFLVNGVQGGLHVLKATFSGGAWHLEAYVSKKVFAGDESAFFAPSKAA